MRMSQCRRQCKTDPLRQVLSDLPARRGRLFSRECSKLALPTLASLPFLCGSPQELANTLNAVPYGCRRTSHCFRSDAKTATPVSHLRDLVEIDSLAVDVFPLPHVVPLAEYEAPDGVRP